MLHLATLERDTQRRAWWLIYILRVGLRLPAIITSARRTVQRQAQLYAQGRSAPGPIVTNTLQSDHVTGRAFDIDMSGHRPDDVPIPVWEAAGHIGEQIGLSWGGRWRLRDFRHFQR